MDNENCGCDEVFGSKNWQSCCYLIIWIMGFVPRMGDESTVTGLSLSTLGCIMWKDL